jgi:hypothetical protein
LQFSTCSGEYFDLRDTAIVIWNKIDSTFIDTVICAGSIYRDRYFTLTDADTGTHTRMILNAAGCDSLYYQLDLAVQKFSVHDTTITVCDNEEIEYRGQFFRHRGPFSADYPFVDRYTTGNYCDSVRYTLHFNVLPPISYSLTHANSINGPNSGWINISNLTPGCYYTVNGVRNAPLNNLPVGTYEIRVFNENDCEGYSQTVEIETECLDITLNVDSMEVCADSPDIIFPYTVNSGYPLYYSLTYDSTALKAGFVNEEMQPVQRVGGNIVIAMPDSLRPNNGYSAHIFFKDRNAGNPECKDIEFDFDFDVLYPSSIVAQKWNDVLVVYNEYWNGGYTFSNYQWYKNGQSIFGQNGSYLYLGENNTFDVEDYYQVKLKRAGETDEVFSCRIYPVRREYDNSTIYPTLMKRGEIWKPVGKTEGNGTIEVWDVMGVVLASQTFENGAIEIRMPDLQGVFVVKIRWDDGTDKIVNVIVK